MAKAVFPKFTELAAELQHRIWFFSLPPPTIVEIEFCPLAGHWFSPLASLTPSCGLLGACVDSRSMYLRYYKSTVSAAEGCTDELNWDGKCEHTFLLRKNGEGEGADEVFQRLMYVDFDVDTVYIGPSSQGDLCFTEFSLKCLSEVVPMIENLKYLAVEDEEWSNELTISEGEVGILVRLFKQLEKVSVVVGDISWIAMRHEHGERTQGKIELVDCGDFHWLRKATTRIETRWRTAADEFEAEGGKIHFGLDVKRILRGGKRWRGHLDMLY